MSLFGTTGDLGESRLMLFDAGPFSSVGELAS